MIILCKRCNKKASVLVEEFSNEGRIYSAFLCDDCLRIFKTNHLVINQKFGYSYKITVLKEKVTFT